MTNKLLALLLLVISGCGGCSSYPTIPHQEEATALVWAFYGESRPVPAIEWIEPQDLNCGQNNGGFYRRQIYAELATNAPKQCVAGVFWSDLYLIQVAHPDNFTFPMSAFSHELYHAHLWLTTGSGDGEHKTEGFQPGGAVSQANDALVDAGIIR